MSNLAGSLGDVFWDLPPSVAHSPGSELGCTIYVANPTEDEKEYALISRLEAGETVVSEESITVFGYTWFKVEPGDFIKLRGALQFEETDVSLIILLIERESQEITDSVATYLVPSAAVSGWPIGWPGGAAIAPSDLSWLLPLMTLGFMGAMVVSLSKPRKEEEKAVAPAEERKLLPPGRYK